MSNLETDKRMGTEKRKTSEKNDNNSSSLIGRVIEKGFSSPATCFPPQPTVLPFPVARHRSSGPHWTPLPTNVPIENNENEEDDMITVGLTEFAVPLLPRKQKKKLNFSKWKEILQSKNTTSTKVNSSNGSAKKSSKIVSPKPLFDSQPAAMDIGRESSLDLPIVDDVMEEVDRHVEDPAFRAAKYPIVYSSNSLKLEEKQEAMSIESQIDEENCARLNEMSDNEIVQAQVELMQKMKPGLLEKLKKRGQTKLDQTKSSAPTTSASEYHLQRDLQSTPLVDVNEHVSQVLPSKSILLSGGTEPVVRSKNDMWISWSERVEAARNLRFSFDGNIIVEDQSVVTSNNGAIPDWSQHNDSNVGERDYLRTEGDPSAAGYTIKEAVALSRSMIPGQRTFALRLLASVLGKALRNLHHSQGDCNLSNASSRDKPVDWKAVWAYALGPEPELALLLRLTLDDNHSAIVSATLKAIQCVLSCEMNERFFDLSAKLSTYEKVVYTAPVFRSKPEVSTGYLHGGYWKYNTKPSNMLSSFGEDEMVNNDENEGKHTIKDDINVASQDFAGGLVKMGILPKIQFQLEEDCSSDIEELLISILIGLVRHSPKCASAIIECPRLVQLIVDRFVKKDTMKVHPSKIKAVTLIKVLAQSDKKVCAEFIEKGIFRTLTWHLSQYPVTLEDWIHLGKVSCIHKSALIVEQLRLWKVCIQYGYCVSSFRIIFPGLYMWMTPSAFDKLIENDVLGEFTSITRELYLVMEALAKRLPYLHSGEQLKVPIEELSDSNVEMWSWGNVVPIVDLALSWISLKSSPYLSKFFDSFEGTDYVKNSTDLLWAISAVIHMLSTVIVKIALKDYNGSCKNDGRVPWLPEFVPKIGLEIIKNKFLDFSGANGMDSGKKSLIKLLGKLRHDKDLELSLSSACCMQGLIQLIVALDNSIQTAKKEIQTTFSQRYSFSVECKILEDGIVTRSRDELKCLLNSFMKSISCGWRELQLIETFGRGGPAPGVGLGWGSSDGGFWSEVVLLKRTDALLLVDLLEIFQKVTESDALASEEISFPMQRVESLLALCLTLGPRDFGIMERSLNLFLQPPTLKYLDLCVSRLLVNWGAQPFGWNFVEEDYRCFSKTLHSHFKNRWLSIKKKKSIEADSMPDKHKRGLDTIYEDPETSEVTIRNPQCTSLIVEWAHQRLPLPVHWFLSPLSTIGDSLSASDALEVAMSGLFLLLGLEAMCSLLCTDAESSPLLAVPLVWKIHSLSIVLLGGMGVLQEERSRDLFRVLQQLYGQLLNESRFDNEAKLLADKNGTEAEKKCEVDFLMFKTDISGNYTIFIETLVDQFGAVSYGDELYGRQVAVYLHHSVELSVRVSTWNTLSNAHILELLPPLEKCLGAAEGYLEIEDNEEVLEAYVKSWTAGALDRAAVRGSMSFTLALHHLSCFFFQNKTDDKSILRMKLTKSLLRDYSRKEQHKRMLMELIRYTKQETCAESVRKEAALLQPSEIERRFKLLEEACQGERSLLEKVEKLKSENR